VKQAHQRMQSKPTSRLLLVAPRPISNPINNGSQVLHPDRLRNVFVNASVRRASHGLRAGDTRESGDVDLAGFETALGGADLVGGFEAVHDLTRYR